MAAQGGEAIGKDENRRAHLALMDEPGCAFGEVVAERLPGRMRQARAGEADQVVEHRKSPLAGAVVVLRRQPYGELARMRIAQRVVPRDGRSVFENEESAGRGRGTLECHDDFVPCSRRTRLLHVRRRPDELSAFDATHAERLVQFLAHLCLELKIGGYAKTRPADRG